MVHDSTGSFFKAAMMMGLPKDMQMHANMSTDELSLRYDFLNALTTTCRFHHSRLKAVSCNVGYGKAIYMCRRSRNGRSFSGYRMTNFGASVWMGQAYKKYYLVVCDFMTQPATLQPLACRDNFIFMRSTLPLEDVIGPYKKRKGKPEVLFPPFAKQ